MTPLPPVVRTTKIILTTIIGYSNLLVAKVIGLFSAPAAQRYRNRSFRAWGRRLCKNFGMRITIEGRPPSGRFFLVVNHVGYVDVPLIATAVDAAFIAKADLSRWPFLGTVFTAADTIFIDRSRKRDVLRVMRQVEAAMDRGLGVVLFPEGTSGKGDEILRFKPSLLQFAVEGEHEVHYATLTYKTQPGELVPSRGVCWWGDEALLPHYRRLSRLKGGFDAVLRFGERPIRGEDRKQLAQDLREAMLETFEPME